MEKTIKIGKKSVKLNNNTGWAIEYRDQFGHDIIPTLMPLLASVIDVIGGIVKETGKTKDIGIADVLAIIDTDSMMDAIIHASGFEYVEVINITWALAKCADEDIPEPREWVRQFETFPLDKIVPDVFELIFRGLVSSKNLKRLETIKTALQPTNQTTEG